MYCYYCDLMLSKHMVGEPAWEYKIVDFLLIVLVWAAITSYHGLSGLENKHF